MAPSGVAFSTRERGIAQGNSAVHAMKITNRYVAFGQRPATREALGRRALPRSQGEHAPATRSGVDFSTGDVASGRKARGGVLELTLGCGSRAQSQRAGGNRGKRKSRRRLRSNAARSNAPRERCVPSFHTRCLKSGPLIAVTKNLMWEVIRRILSPNLKTRRKVRKFYEDEEVQFDATFLEGYILM